MEKDVELIAVCGLDCGGCPLRTADTDVESAEALVGWFKKEGWIKEDEGAAELMQRGPYCRGCRGNRSIHWSAECWILQCCVDEKGLSFCYQCSVFPCERLEEWAGGSEWYTKALGRLRRMKEEAS
jgi:hypothetical protein